MTRDMAWDFPLGLVAPANFALHAARYLYESPATREHMAMVAVKNHRHGVSKLVETGETAVGGTIPVNPSGGLKAKGHPPGATGIAQCYEIFHQLRGTACNQVDGARWGLAHNVGGPTAVSAVTILSTERP